MDSGCRFGVIGSSFSWPGMVWGMHAGAMPSWTAIEFIPSPMLPAPLLARIVISTTQGIEQEFNSVGTLPRIAAEHEKGERCSLGRGYR